jgi:hypothetical protein
MHNSVRQFRAAVENRRGVALPLALVGLVVVSLLMTTALLTSSTEVAMSSAYQGGVQGLYEMDGALEQYVALKAEDASQGGPGLYPTTEDPLVPNALITVSLLHSRRETLPGDTVRQTETYSLLAEPASGRGRSVGAMVTAVRELPPFVFDVNAGITVGGNLKVSGNSAISDSSAVCDLDGAENAIEVSDGSTVTIGGSATIDGTVNVAAYSQTEMVAQLLGGRSLDEAAKLATVKFAPGEFGGKASSYDSNGPKPQTDKTNWGCPVGMGSDCETKSGDNTSYMPSVAIDAGGTKVGLTGDHGQGVLIIHNGSLEVQGNFIYKGIVLVEKDLDIRGTGGSSTKLEGAVLALGDSTQIEDNVTGNAVITYNRCAVNAAKEAFSNQGVEKAPQTFSDGTFAWYEVVR